ncbi:MAG: amidohydrolase family protein [Bacteroidota bacterium]|nr:amidohydrolase family protein [Bacteroidota bacterium]
MKIFQFLTFFAIIFISCKNIEPSNPSFKAYIGATIIDGTGADPIPIGVLLIQYGRVAAIGTQKEIKIPENTLVKEVAGKFITPGFINAHGHVGDVKGIEGGHYSTANLKENLSIYAQYGITTVVSLGDDKKEAVTLRFANDTSATQWARLFIAGEVISGKTPEEAIAVTDRNHSMGVDFMKIRVDDQLGTTEKMSEEVYRAVIDRSHELGYKISAHMYYLEDAHALLDAGADMLAHSIRDLPVDKNFIRKIKENPIGYCPTLTRELSTFVYGDTANFFSDPFFTRIYDEESIQPLKDPERQLTVRNSRSAQIYQQQLPTAMANLKTLSEQGVPIVFGTDSGVPTRFIGYFEHLEMEMMAEAGLSPMQIILSATKNSAQYLGLKDLGTLENGHWADFLILDADPLANIKNARQISGVFIGGHEVYK